ncbi:MAG: hypothetical protein H0T50_03605 [Gemmatimonadales bacterium]|nr:hypothetical protein [Gemmatimonadales bacterium]
MRRLMILLGVIAISSCGGSRSNEGGREMTVDTASGTLEVSGDSARLEDTLSAPPPSDSVR